MKPFLNLRFCSSLSPIFSSHSIPVSLFCFSSLSSCSSSLSYVSNTESKPINNLTEEELTKINLLIPRLCISSHLPEAIRLVDASLLFTNPSLKSLSLSILVHSLTSQPDMTQPMSLLTRLKHNPHAHSSLLSINTMLISSYFKKGKPREAFKVYQWMTRPGSPCEPSAEVFGILVCGFCRSGIVIEALKALRAMVSGNCVPGSGLRTRVYRSLLREARVVEAKELNKCLEALIGVGDDCGGEGAEEEEKKKRVVELLDQMITNWTD